MSAVMWHLSQGKLAPIVDDELPDGNFEPATSPKHIVFMPERCSDIFKRRDDVIININDDYFKKYKELKGKKGGIAVAVLKDNFCNVCNMQIPAIAAEKIEDVDEIYSCPLCSRMAVIYRGEIDSIKKELES